MRHFGTLLLLCALACAGDKPSPAPAAKAPLPPFAVAKEPPPPRLHPGIFTTVIRNATIMTATGTTFHDGYLVMKNGLIQAVGSGAPPVLQGARDIDATGKFVTPGIIDVHSHLGVYPLPDTEGNADGNEMTDPVTAELFAEHSFWPQDPALSRALAGGVTTIHVLPGSANLVGGRGTVLKLRRAVNAAQMRFVQAQSSLKMACGENPKRTYGKKGGPSTRMGNIATLRAALQEATEYRYKQQKYERDLAAWRAKREADDKSADPPEPPTRNFGLETLAQLLEGKLWVHNHCYRADEMHLMMDLAKMYGFKIRSFHHALEAYKLRERLAAEDIAVSTWADWWGFKMEAFDGIPYNAALLSKAGVRVVIHSDSEHDIRHLNQEAAKAMASGIQLGIALDDNEALRWITANAAWVLGVDGLTGTLDVGKMADVVIWNKHPLDTYALAQMVFIDGEMVFARDASPTQAGSDFEVGLHNGAWP